VSSTDIIVVGFDEPYWYEVPPKFWEGYEVQKKSWLSNNQSSQKVNQRSDQKTSQQSSQQNQHQRPKLKNRFLLPTSSRAMAEKTKQSAIAHKSHRAQIRQSKRNHQPSQLSQPLISQSLDHPLARLRSRLCQKARQLRRLLQVEQPLT
jgi:hypothetical protein